MRMQSMIAQELERWGLAVQIVCVVLGFFCVYLAFVWNPVFFFVSPLPYILIYNVFFRGYLARKQDGVE